MNLSIINRSRTEVSKSTVKNWVMQISKHVPELKHYAELTLVFVTSAEMRSLNHKFRGKDYATDVLSFEPMDNGTFTAPKKAGKGGKKLPMSAATRAKLAERPLGELVFCLSIIRRQAKLHELTFEQELGYMIIHGVLHLLGYEHENGGAKAKKMYKLQDQTFAKLIRK